MRRMCWRGVSKGRFGAATARLEIHEFDRHGVRLSLLETMHESGAPGVPSVRIDRRSYPVEVDGVLYPSMASAARALNMRPTELAKILN